MFVSVTPLKERSSHEFDLVFEPLRRTAGISNIQIFLKPPECLENLRFSLCSTVAAEFVFQKFCHRHRIAFVIKALKYVPKLLSIAPHLGPPIFRGGLFDT